MIALEAQREATLNNNDALQIQQAQAQNAQNLQQLNMLQQLNANLQNNNAALPVNPNPNPDPDPMDVDEADAV